jgi:hypothetical protein
MSVGIDVNINTHAGFSENKVEDPFACGKPDGCGREKPIVGEQEIDRHLPVPVRKIELLHNMRVVLLPVLLSIVSAAFRIRSLEGLYKPSVAQKGEGIRVIDKALPGALSAALTGRSDA